jgi:hypothetical protein
VAINAACTDLDDSAFLRWTQALRLTHLNLHATRVTGASFRHIIGMHAHPHCLAVLLLSDLLLTGFIAQE